MIHRTGKECKKGKCANYIAYSHWGYNLGSNSLKECMNCKYAFASQYHVEVKK